MLFDLFLLPHPSPLRSFHDEKKEKPLYLKFNKISKVVPKQALERKQGYAGYETQLLLAV